MAGKSICSIEGCIKIAEKRGWCGAHYARWRRHGDPLGGGTPDGAPMRWIEEILRRTDTDRCQLWPFSTTGNGYPKTGGGQDTILVHRYVCIKAHGEPVGDRNEAAHNCGMKLCCNPNHLRWATRSENLGDRVMHGTVNRGLRNGNGKLTDAQVLEIASRVGAESQREIADQFNVGQQLVSLIHNKKV